MAVSKDVNREQSCQKFGKKICNIHVVTPQFPPTWAKKPLPLAINGTWQEKKVANKINNGPCSVLEIWGNGTGCMRRVG